MRGAKSANLNYSCNDVIWSRVDSNLLATAATNGAIVVWNITRLVDLFFCKFSSIFYGSVKGGKITATQKFWRKDHASISAFLHCHLLLTNMTF